METLVSLNEYSVANSDFNHRDTAYHLAQNDLNIINQRWLQGVSATVAGARIIQLDRLLDAVQRVKTAERDLVRSQVEMVLAALNMYRAKGRYLQYAKVEIVAPGLDDESPYYRLKQVAR